MIGAVFLLKMVLIERIVNDIRILSEMVHALPTKPKKLPMKRQEKFIKLLYNLDRKWWFNMSQSYTPEDLAHLLQVSKLTVYDLIKKGDIPAYRVGRQMRIDAVDIERYKSRGKEVKQQVAESSSSLRTVVITGQDNSLDMLARELEKSGTLQPLRSYASSMDGLISMYKGEADIVSTHLLDGDTETYNLSYVKKLLVSHSFKLIRFIRREVGFYVAAGNPKNIQSWKDVQKNNVTLANREAGAGARVLVDEQLRVHHISREQIQGYDTSFTSHMAVASEVQSGRADVGVGIRQVADMSRLDFIPLKTEHYDLVLANHPNNREVVNQVEQILLDEHFQQQLQTLHYDIKDIGTVLYEQ